MSAQGRFSRWSQRLYVRLFLMIALVLLVFQWLFTLFLNDYYSSQYRAQIQDMGNAALANAGYQIQSALEKMDNTAYTLAYSEIGQRYLNLRTKESEYTRLKVFRDMDSLLRVAKLQCPRGVEYTLYPHAHIGLKTTVNSNSNNPSYDYHQEAWYQYMAEYPHVRRVLLPNQRILGPDQGVTAPTHLLAYRVNNFSTLEYNGFLVQRFNKDTFAEMIGALPVSIQNVLIVDENDELLYEDMSFLVRDVLISDAEHSGGRIKAAHGEQYLALSQRIEPLKWRIIGTVDASAGAARLALFRLVASVAMAASLVLVLVAIYGISRRITRPVARLSAGMENIRLGQYDVQLPVERRDEIGALTDAFNSMANQLHDANARLQRYEVLQQSISFYALQQQVNPHFLYNTLNMIIGMATEGHIAPIIEVSSSLAQMFRYCLSRELTAPLEQEIAHIENYFSISRLRHGSLLDMDLQVDVQDIKIYVPKLILQPFVENSFKYGLAGTGGRLMLRVTIKETQGGMLHILMSDNGVGFPADVLSELASAFTGGEGNVPAEHIGILNVYARLRALYQDAFSMDVFNDPEGGACVRMEIPIDVPISLV